MIQILLTFLTALSAKSVTYPDELLVSDPVVDRVQLELNAETTYHCNHPRVVLQHLESPFPDLHFYRISLVPKNRMKCSGGKKGIRVGVNLIKALNEGHEGDFILVSDAGSAVKFSFYPEKFAR